MRVRGRVRVRVRDGDGVRVGVRVRVRVRGGEVVDRGQAEPQPVETPALLAHHAEDQLRVGTHLG